MKHFAILWFLGYSLAIWAQNPPIMLSQTFSSIEIGFNEAIGVTNRDEILAYEVSYKSLSDSSWTVSPNNFGSYDVNISFSQIVSVRVDNGKEIPAGSFFQLGLERSQLLAEDMEAAARTAFIPYDATASVMKSALQQLKGVEIQEVKRCDAFAPTGDTSVGYGGTNSWTFGCPYRSRGGYRWLIVFKAPRSGIYVPPLFSYFTSLGTSTWSGPGPQVAVFPMKSGMIHPSVCSITTFLCRKNITSLEEGTSYMFKVRHLSEYSGWSHTTSTSPLFTTLQRRIPPRPRPPTLYSANSTSLVLQILDPAPEYSILEFQAQYQSPSLSSTWTQGPSFSPFVNRKHGTLLVFSIIGLTPATDYSIRLRQRNDVGWSVWSPASPLFTTLLTSSSYPTRPPAPLIDPLSIGSTWIKATLFSDPSPLVPLGALSYRLQYRSEEEEKLASLQQSFSDPISSSINQQVDQNWHNLASSVVSFSARTEGVAIQEVSTRSNGVKGCDGYFWLRLGLTEATNQVATVSSPLRYDASVEEMKAALLAIGNINSFQPRIAVHRRLNSFNGYTWKIEIQGMGDITRLQLFRHTLVLIPSNTAYNPNMTFSSSSSTTSTQPCYAGADPVTTSTVQQGGDQFHSQSQTVQVAGLQPERTYRFRVIQILPDGSVGPVSNITSCTTLSPTEEQRRLSIGVMERTGVEQSGLPRSAGGPATVVAGIQGTPAKTSDPSYPSTANILVTTSSSSLTSFRSNIGRGGHSGEDGGPGYCIVSLHSSRLPQPFQAQEYLFSGGSGSWQQLAIPAATPSEGGIDWVSFKCWGAGGGGGKITDLVSFSSGNDTFGSNTTSTLPDPSLFSIGGGGGFAEISVAVQGGDIFSIFVGGGGQCAQGTQGGLGGAGGGGDGGKGVEGGGGGGGGGASMVFVSRASSASAFATSFAQATSTDSSMGPFPGNRGDLVLVAAGGAGGGSTDYCCAQGGAGGGVWGLPGSFPGSNTPWPLSSASDPTPILLRSEYTAVACPPGSTGDFCLSPWDVLSNSLPAEHANLQHGEFPMANYSQWALAGQGGGPSVELPGGSPGRDSSFQTRTTGTRNILNFDGVAVFNQYPGWSPSQGGALLTGGHGGEGLEGGGGGGGGYFGGGGGGSGIDGAGGGGGSSFVNHSLSYQIFRTSFSSSGFGSSNIITNFQILYANSTSVKVSWQFNWEKSLQGLPHHFLLEVSRGPYSQDYSPFLEVPLPWDVSAISSSVTSKSPLTSPAFFLAGNQAMMLQAILSSLEPSSTYGLRIVPYFSQGGRGRPSSAFQITTLAITFNYWEPVLGRRLSLSTLGGGWSYPVLQRPHLDPEVEIYTSEVSSNPLRYSDSPTRLAPSLPAGRQGESLTWGNNGQVYMFGGRTDGYTCASVYKDLLNLGTPQSGRDVYPCTHWQAEVNEVWSLDVHTYEWNYLNTSLWNEWIPLPRELHSASYLDGSLYIFGGRRKLVSSSSSAFTSSSSSSSSSSKNISQTFFFGDLWRLQLPLTYHVYFPWQATNTSQTSLPSGHLIPQNDRLLVGIHPSPSSAHAEANSVLPDPLGWGDGLNVRQGLCVKKVNVEVEVYHDCLSQLQISLWGPGPLTGSFNFHALDASNYEVRLLHQVKSPNSTCISGWNHFYFDDLASQGIPLDFSSPWKGPLRPEGQLAHFQGTSPLAEWFLSVEDTVQDNLEGVLKSWTFHVELEDCSPTFRWTPIFNGTSTMVTSTSSASSSASSTTPPPRYGAMMASFQHHLFLFGGRDASNRPLSDLYRLDLSSTSSLRGSGAQWVLLKPVGFSFGYEVAMSAGSSFALTTWGLIRYGGYYRQPYLSSTSSASATPSKVMSTNTTTSSSSSSTVGNTSTSTPPSSPQVASSTASYSFPSYESQLFVLDPNTFRWKAMMVEDFPLHGGIQGGSTLGISRPAPRYNSGIVFLPSSQVKSGAMKFFSSSSSVATVADESISDRMLYDEKLSSTSVNYMGSFVDSLLVYGGFNGASGTIVDGSTGGMLNDMWMVRLANWSTIGMRTTQQQYLDRVCQGRLVAIANAAASNSSNSVFLSCLGPSGSTCNVRDFIMLPWCASTNQTVM